MNWGISTMYLQSLDGVVLRRVWHSGFLRNRNVRLSPTSLLLHSFEQHWNCWQASNALCQKSTVKGSLCKSNTAKVFLILLWVLPRLAKGKQRPTKKYTREKCVQHQARGQLDLPQFSLSTVCVMTKALNQVLHKLKPSFRGDFSCLLPTI